jgi:hypothetical protein
MVMSPLTPDCDQPARPTSAPTLSSRAAEGSGPTKLRQPLAEQSARSRCQIQPARVCDAGQMKASQKLATQRRLIRTHRQ